ncbi:hypothetical protein [Streptomyces sp. NPDC059874]|uniref:hypothetical protein n=1 Tax=Streptomyces sp. NPDC059874 TaxID=3346983 RepID=UPI00365CDF30
MSKIISWGSARTFTVWQYGIGHSQLLLSGRGTGTEPDLGVHFEGVEFMRLIRVFRNLRIATADEHHIREIENSGIPSLRPLLMLALHHDEGVGLVACSRLRIGQTPANGKPTWNLTDIQLHASATG